MRNLTIKHSTANFLHVMYMHGMFWKLHEYFFQLLPIL